MLCVASFIGFTANVCQAAPANTEGPVTIYVTPYLQWDSSPTNVVYPGYTAYSAEVVQSMYESNSISGSISDHKLLTSYVAQPNAESGYVTSKWLWASVRVVAKDPAYRFLPKYLRFESTSTDGLLNGVQYFTNVNYSYTYSSRGVTWDSVGPRHGDTVANGFWKDSMINEFIFNGAATPYFRCGSSYTMTDLNGYLFGFVVDYAVTLKWTFDDGTNQPVSAQITLHTKKSASNGELGIVRSGANVVLGITGNSDDSWILQSAPRVPKGTNTVVMDWHDEASMNAGDVYIRPTTPGQYYWRARLQ